MLKINTVVTSPVMTNTYILTFFNGQAIVVDPGGEKQKIDAILKKEDAVCKAVLLTHAHFDHAGAAAALQRDGAAVYMHRADVPLIRDGNMAAELCGTTLEPFTPDVLFDGDEGEREICEQSVRVMHTPGHTPGGVCYIIGGALFSGDTLFYLSAGRTDFPGGDPLALSNSLKELCRLKCDYPVYPGHARMTSLRFEKENNPYV